MRSTIKIIGAAVAALCTSTTIAQTDKEPVRMLNSQSDYVVQSNGQFSEDREVVYQVTHKSAIERAKRGGFSFSTSAQTGEVIHAYTEKPNGRRADVRKDSFQFEVNKGIDANKPAYSDVTSVSIIFPDVEVNDKVVIKYRVNTHQPVYANHFSVAEVFSPSYLYDRAAVTVTLPVSMRAKFSVNGCSQTESANIEKKLVTVSMECSNKKRPTKERKNWSVNELEDSAGLLFSTHPDYASIAAAYGRGALPKAVVTPRIEKLGKEVVGAVTEPREKARLLYEWVATNIGYAGNCVGIGAVVPRDVDWTLENNLGDCKDHATVLQALLTAQGIRSTQALVNAGSAYRLANLPRDHDAA